MLIVSQNHASLYLIDFMEFDSVNYLTILYVDTNLYHFGMVARASQAGFFELMATHSPS